MKRHACVLLLALAQPRYGAQAQDIHGWPRQIPIEAVSVFSPSIGCTPMDLTLADRSTFSEATGANNADKINDYLRTYQRGQGFRALFIPGGRALAIAGDPDGPDDIPSNSDDGQRIVFPPRTSDAFYGGGGLVAGRALSSKSIGPAAQLVVVDAATNVEPAVILQGQGTVIGGINLAGWKWLTGGQPPKGLEKVAVGFRIEDHNPPNSAKHHFFDMGVTGCRTAFCVSQSNFGDNISWTHIISADNDIFFQCDEQQANAFTFSHLTTGGTTVVFDMRKGGSLWVHGLNVNGPAKIVVRTGDISFNNAYVLLNGIKIDNGAFSDGLRLLQMRRNLDPYGLTFRAFGILGHNQSRMKDPAEMIEVRGSQNDIKLDLNNLPEGLRAYEMFP